MIKCEKYRSKDKKLPSPWDCARISTKLIDECIFTKMHLHPLKNLTSWNKVSWKKEPMELPIINLILSREPANNKYIIQNTSNDDFSRNIETQKLLV